MPTDTTFLQTIQPIDDDTIKLDVNGKMYVDFSIYDPIKNIGVFNDTLDGWTKADVVGVNTLSYSEIIAGLKKALYNSSDNNSGKYTLKKTVDMTGYKFLSFIFSGGNNSYTSSIVVKINNVTVHSSNLGQYNMVYYNIFPVCLIDLSAYQGSYEITFEITGKSNEISTIQLLR